MAQHDDKKLIAPTADKLRVPNAWLISLGDRTHLTGFSVTVTDEPNRHSSIADGDGIMIVHKNEDTLVSVAFARVYRSRVTSDAMTVYFDGIVRLDPPPDLASLGVTPPETDAPISRLDWPIFENALKSAAGIDFSGIPVIEGDSPREQAYIRELLQLAVMDDILGPASGPEEEIVGMSVRDRYLVGKLAPRTADEDECIEGLQGPAALDEGVADGETPDDLRPFEEVGSGRD